MKKISLVFILCFVVKFSFSQSDKDDGGLFKNLKIKPGLTMTYFHNFQGSFSYILQQNARVVQQADDKDGASLSVVVLIPFDDEGVFHFLINLPVIDVKGASTSYFNSQTPFGVGLAVFPFENAKFFGFTAMTNIGRVNKLRQSAIDNQFFPIADYPTYKLAVGAAVPDGVLEPFYYKVTTISLNAGIVIKL